MPLTTIQEKVFRLLREHRNPESHVAGATALHADPRSPRYSEDIDIFHDVARLVGENAASDTSTLQAHGFIVEWITRGETFHRAIVSDGNDRLKIEWVHDSAFRFFPVEPDPLLGYRLHRADLAVNKVLAAAGRAVARDFIDVLYLNATYLTIGALVWAATGKDPGMSPLFILNELVRTSRYQPEDLARLSLASPVSLPELKMELLAGVRDAEELINRLPQHEVGCLYLDANNQPVTPDPDRPDFPMLTRHFGSLRGSWPRVCE